MKLIVAYDGSEHAKEAIRYALPYLQGAEVTIFVAFKPESSFFESQASAEEHLREGQAKAEAFAAEATALIGDAPVKLESAIELVGNMDVGDLLLERAGEAGAECIVLGTRGQGEIKSKLFGSVTQRVLNHSGELPVLVVHPGAADTRESHGHRVLFTIDGTELSLRAVEQGACFVDEGSDVTFFHAYQEPQKFITYPTGLDMGFSSFTVIENDSHGKECEALRVKHAELRAQAVDRLTAASSVEIPAQNIHLTLYTAEEPAAGVGVCLKEKGIDLVVVGSRGETGLTRISNGSLAHDLLHKEEPFAVFVTH